MSNVYMIQCEDYVKIGMSSNIKARLDSLQTANPFRLQVLDFIYCGSSKAANWLESVFHQDLSSHRVNTKSEWFDYNEEVIVYFTKAKQRYPKEEVERWNTDFEAILEARSLSEYRSGFVANAKTEEAKRLYPFGLKCWETKAFYPPEVGAADYFTEHAINYKEPLCRI